MNQKISFKNFLLIIGFFTASWIIVHMLAFFGVFIAAAYPFWWLMFPKTTLCIGCRSQKSGGVCKFCKISVEEENPTYPKNFRSVILNSLFIIFITLFSLLIVILESKLILGTTILPRQKTASLEIPAQGQFPLGKVFPITIEVSNIKTAVNAVQTDISFDFEKLELIDISTEGSFANIFVNKEINNEIGFASIAGGLPNPGFSDESGIFATAFFRGISPGLATIEFLPTSMVLANDGKGSNMLEKLSSVSYLILPDVVPENEATSSAINVLGKSSDQVQFKFYDEGSITPSSISSTVTPKAEKPNPFLWLKSIDEKILDFWSRLITLDF